MTYQLENGRLEGLKVKASSNAKVHFFLLPANVKTGYISGGGQF